MKTGCGQNKAQKEKSELHLTEALQSLRRQLETVEQTQAGMEASLRQKEAKIWLSFNHFASTVSLKDTGKAIGLGPSMPQAVIEHQGGTIEGDNMSNKSSSIRNYLPGTNEGAVDERPANETDHPKPQVLVVEDDSEVLKLVGDLLEDSGYFPLKANNGEAALAALAEDAEPVVLALIDMVMPGMNGMELYREITVTHPNLPVIFTTGYDAEAYRDITPSDYPMMQKPYTPSDLLGMVRKVLGQANGLGVGPRHSTSADDHGG